MAINFNELPTEKPAMGTVVPAGQYLATIADATMKTGNDETKPPYLSVQLDLTDEASATPVGKIWAIFTESEKPLPRYQLSRLIKALSLPITGSFELKDLTKMIKGKKMLVDVVPEKRTDGKAPERSVVDISAEMYYPYTENTMTEELTGSEDTNEIRSQY